MENIEYEADYSSNKLLIEGIRCPECHEEIEQEIDLKDYDFWIDEDGLVDKIYIYCECGEEIELEVDGESWLEYAISKLTYRPKTG